MPKPAKVVLFVGPPAAASTFTAAAGRLGLPWAAVHKAAPTPEDLSAADRVVAVGPADVSHPHLETWPADADLAKEVNAFIARLLGGGTRPEPPPVVPSPPPKAPPATVRVGRETAGRRGKGVTVITDVPLTGDALLALAASLKAKCGTGGTVKDGRIEIQGDHRDRLVGELEKLGYRVKRSGG